MQFVLIILLSTLAAILYGIVHDLITAHVCLEYFTIAHPPIFHATQNPIVLALGWGVIATWWVGLPLGILLALAARIGPEPKLTARQLLFPVTIGLASVFLLAMLIGGYAYFNIELGAGWQAAIPPAHHRHFAFDAAAHLASYALGAILGIVLCLYALIIRIRRFLAAQRFPSQALSV